MIISEKDITFGNNTLTVTNQRVIFWSTEKALILSDLHLGKSTHFRQNGIAVPQEILYNDLLRLEQLIKHYSPEKMIVVGDLFHAGKNIEFEVFGEWKKQFSLDWVLIKGNHDRLRQEVYKHLNLKVYEELTLQNITFKHHPTDDSERFTISGHIHPGIMMKGLGKQKIKLPCFLYSNCQLILPAFSQFTGLDTRLSNNYKAIGFTDEALVEL